MNKLIFVNMNYYIINIYIYIKMYTILYCSFFFKKKKIIIKINFKLLKKFY